MTMPSVKILLIPTLAILGVSAGAVASAYAFDQVASRYLWPEPENLVVQQAAQERQRAQPSLEDLQKEYIPLVEPIAEATTPDVE